MPTLAVSDYKGVSYARKFPDNERVYERASPFGYLEIYSSSYLHFAPGLSDNAAFNLPSMPANAYLGLYIDGEGPSGICPDGCSAVCDLLCDTRLRGEGCQPWSEDAHEGRTCVQIITIPTT